MYVLRVRLGVGMPKITKADVEYVAGIAQLTLDEDAKERLVGELGTILDYMETLNRLDTSDVEPMMHVQEMANVFRNDEVRPPLERAAALANAPKHDGEYFLVPKILDAD